MAVFGGSLGARRINGAVLDLADRWADRDDRSIYHVVGRRDVGRLRAVAGRARAGADADGPGAGAGWPTRTGWTLVYAAADVVVCRAGAMTVAELAVAGVPSILVPLPGAPGDHQTANARVLERAGAAVLLPDDRCDADRPGHRPRRPARTAGACSAPWVGRPPRHWVAPTPPPPGPGGRGQCRSPAALADRLTSVSPDRRRSGCSATATRPARVHVVGIGGAGMSAIAIGARTPWATRSPGSDLKSSAVTDRLRSGRDRRDDRATPRPTWDRPIWSPCRRPSPTPTPRWWRPDAAASPCCRRAESLAAIASLRRCVAVAGTHGKTTTASMLALLLVEAGLRPSFLIGGDVNEIGTNAVWDEGEWLVVEADESDGTLPLAGARHRGGHQCRGRPPGPLRLVRRRPIGLRGLPEQRPGPRVVGGDDQVAAEIGRSTGADIVGTAPDSTVRMVDIELARSSLAFALVDDSGRPLGRLAVAGPRTPQRQERRSGRGGRPGRRGPLRRRWPGPWPASPGWPAGSSSAVRPTG